MAQNMTINPDPKPKVIILKGKEYHEFRKRVAARAMWGCEYCGRFADFDSKTLVNGEISHIRKRKFYGDVMTNVKWSCLWCHRKNHDGNI